MEEGVQYTRIAGQRLYSAVAITSEANGDVSLLRAFDQWGKKADAPNINLSTPSQRAELNAVPPTAPPIVGACGGEWRGGGGAQQADF